MFWIPEHSDLSTLGGWVLKYGECCVLPSIAQQALSIKSGVAELWEWFNSNPHELDAAYAISLLTHEQQRSELAYVKFREAFKFLMNGVSQQAIGSELANRLKEDAEKLAAAATSRACDTKPIEQDQPKTHVEVIEDATEVVKKTVKHLKAYESWDESSERKRAVRSFLKVTRDAANAFEKHASVGAEPNKTLFEGDADIPEHLQQEPFLSAWDSWWADRKKRKLSVSPVTKKRQLNLLAFGDADQAAAIVSKAEENQWQGIPDSIWIPKRADELWCERMPAHATPEMITKIQAAIGKLTTGFSSAKPPNGTKSRADVGVYNPNVNDIPIEERLRRARL